MRLRRRAWFRVMDPAMSVPILRCRHCGEWYQVQRTVPDVCPFCAQSAMWTTEPVKKTWLTRTDVLFLKAIKIQPFEPE